MVDLRKRFQVHGLRLIPNSILRKFSGLILYVLITILVVSMYGGRYGFLEKSATQMQDGMFKLRGKAGATTAEIVIVGIDDRSVDNISGWPWERDLLGQLISLVAQGSPKLIGLDIFLPEEINQDTSGRTEFLANEIHAAANVVLPIYFSLSDVGIAPESAPGRIMLSAVDDTRNTRTGKSSLVYARQIYYPSPALVEASSGFGHINMHYDGDGLIRREPLLINYDGYLYPSLGLRLASMYLNVRPDQIKPKGEGGLLVGKILIPTDKNQRMLLNYRGPSLSFERTSALKVFAGEVPPETFEDKIVLVGLTTTESKTWIKAPHFGEINEVERIATVTDNIIHGNFLKHISPFWNVLVLILVGIFCALVLPNVSLTYRIVILLVFLFVVFNLSYILFSSFGILTKPIYPIIELVLFLLASPAVKPKGPREKTSETVVAEIGDGEGAQESRADSGETAEPPAETKEDVSTPIVATESIIEKNIQKDLSATDSGARVVRPEQEMPAPDSERELSVEETMRLPDTFMPRASSEPSPTPTPLSETPSVSRFGRYKIIEVLGRGGMGAVYKGLDPVLDRPVALKTIRLDFALSSAEMSELKERLIQEAKAAGRLSHPNIVTIYDVGEEGGLQYIAMEHLSGYTLEDFIKKKGVLNYKIAAKIIMQTCDALSYAHQHGIVHRDIKPSNIMLLEDFHVKVMDFGIARLETTSLTKSNVALGTPHYISPEQLEGNLADKRSDIFSLGVVIYELLTKKKPFQGENISSLMYRILNHQPPPPSAVDDRIPLVFDQVVSKAMAKRPEDRYRDAKEITRVMREFVSSFVVTRSIRI